MTADKGSGMLRFFVDRRCIKILQILSERQDYISIGQLADLLEQTRRQTQYDIYKINMIFDTVGLPPVETKKKKGVCLLEAHKTWWREFNGAKENSYNYIFTQEERCAVIIAEGILSSRIQNFDSLSERFQVSRNTIFLDMKLVQKKLKDFDIILEYNQAAGYQILGAEMNKRSIFLYYLSILWPLVEEGILDYLSWDTVRGHLCKLHSIENALEVHYRGGILEKLAVLLSFSENVLTWDEVRHTDESLFVLDTEYIRKTRVYEEICAQYPEWTEGEKIYIGIQLLGARLDMGSAIQEGNLEFFEKLAEKLIVRFETLAGINIEERERLKHNLALHLQHSIYRYAYSITEEEGIGEEIKKQAEELFVVVRKAADEFSKEIHHPINDTEAAYLTVYFSQHMQQTTSRASRVRVLLVVSEMKEEERESLKYQLEDSMPMFVAAAVCTKREYPAVNRDSYDIIVSTVLLDCPDSYALVSEYMDASDRRAVLQEYMRYRQHSMGSLGAELLEEILPYIPKENHEKVQNIVERYLFPKTSNLFQLLRRENLQIVSSLEENMDWRDAIFQAAFPLLSGRYIDRSYIDAMIMNVEMFGMYTWFGNGVYLAHAKAENNVYRSGVALMTIRKGIMFREQKKVFLLIVFASIDQKEHLSVLKEVVKLCNNVDKIQALLECQDEEALYQTIGVISGDV